MNIPLSYKAMNAIGKTLMKFLPSFLNLDERALVERAQRQARLSDFGHPYYREGLSRLLISLEQDANLHPIGRFMAESLITGYLVQRLRFIRSLHAQPEIYRQPLKPPLIITGLARSGTSFLQRMLAVDAHHRALPQWQLMYPFPEHGHNASTPDRRYKDMEQALRFRKPLASGIDAIHYTRADTAEECLVVQGLTFNSLVFPMLFAVSGYLDWYLSAQDVVQKIEEYLRLLQYFQFDQPDQRLVLKTPAHTGNLAQIKQAIPQAMLIQTHRSPAVCISSLCSLGYTFRSASSHQVDKKRMGNEAVALFDHWIVRNLEFRKQHPGVVYDVDYQALVSEPKETVRELYAHFDLPWTEQYEQALERYIHNNPQHKFGKHTYSASDFGLNEEEIAERYRFYSDYVGCL